MDQSSLLQNNKDKQHLNYWKELPENTRVMLISAIYSGENQKVQLKFYDPNLHVIYFWQDKTDHKPYCYTKLEYQKRAEEIAAIEKKFELKIIPKMDLMSDKEIQTIKIIAPDPLSIGGKGGIREKLNVWEANIKYHENYLYDTRLIPGSYYKREGDEIIEDPYKMSDIVYNALKNFLWDKILESKEARNDKYREYVREWADLLNQPIPEMKRIALDIEVDSEEGRMPVPKEHDRKITAVGIVSNDGFRKVLLLEQDKNPNDGTALIPEAEMCKTEKELLEKTFDRIWSYSVLVTFNGDDFDLPYLYERSQDPAIDPINHTIIPKEEIPLLVKRDSFIKRGIQAEPVQLKHGVHIDLFRTFQNRSIQIYAFSHKYSEYRLNAISEALLNDSKIEFDGNISDLPIQKLAQYCLKDTELTFRLTSFNDNLLLKLLFAIARISRLSIEDLSRVGVNQWIRGMLFYEHRKINALIPHSEELRYKGQASSEAIIKEKKYRGGLVVEPTPGIHFNVSVVDFASLYPSIIKVHNLSYETVNCPHDSCSQDPDQKITDTSYWTCKEKKGITSLLIGSLRDLRVNYYKQLSKDKIISPEERQLYTVVSQAIKVILNASYGVMGAEIFPLYCLPVADATAAIGRNIITRTIEKCRESGIAVVYGDTDSLFLKDPSEGNVEEISKWAKTNQGVDLELDKEYRYVVFNNLKKNYIGVLKDGTVDVKGLTGKKSHTPAFIRKTFYSMLDILGKVNTEKDFDTAREKIKDIVKESAKKLESNEYPLEELSFNVMINKSPEKYGKKTSENTRITSIHGEDSTTNSIKGIPQHIKAARLFSDNGRQIKAGDIISYVKTKTAEGVKPVELSNHNEIDTEKYLEAMESTFDQLLTALDVNFKSIIGKPRQSNLDELFWSN
ncbi:MAG TPA: DNA-directed DNA polymerase I [Nitrososphaeraceae archaeon]|nr:DNA-directed DNA polymerase I [Nitrososphaeraceae archaeon]